MGWRQFVYQVEEDEKLRGTKPYTMGILLQNISVFYEQQRRLQLRQRIWHWPLRIFNGLVLNRYPFTPYSFFISGQQQGYTRLKCGGRALYLYIQDDLYIIHRHSRNRLSLVKNGTQVALFVKDEITRMEQNTYLVDYVSGIGITAPFLLLLCMYIDTAFYSTRGTITFEKTEKIEVFNDPYPERAKWSSTSDSPNNE